MPRVELKYTFGYEAGNVGSTGPNPPGGWLTPLCEYVATHQTEEAYSLPPNSPDLINMLDYINNGNEYYACTGASGAPQDQIRYQLYKCYLARINESIGINAINPLVGTVGSWDPYINCVDNLPSTPPF